MSDRSQQKPAKIRSFIEQLCVTMSNMIFLYGVHYIFSFYFASFCMNLADKRSCFFRQWWTLISTANWCTALPCIGPPHDKVLSEWNWVKRRVVSVYFGNKHDHLQPSSLYNMKPQTQTSEWMNVNRAFNSVTYLYPLKGCETSALSLFTVFTVNCHCTELKPNLMSKSQCEQTTNIFHFSIQCHNTL
jgi:hypothetical protein